MGRRGFAQSVRTQGITSFQSPATCHMGWRIGRGTCPPDLVKEPTSLPGPPHHLPSPLTESIVSFLVSTETASRASDCPAPGQAQSENCRDRHASGSVLASVQGSFLYRGEGRAGVAGPGIWRLWIQTRSPMEPYLEGKLAKSQSLVSQPSGMPETFHNK